MKKRSSNILSTSRILFNEKGYSNVTIRMIAEELNISSGNLNYHFKKREDILEALYFEMVETFDKRVAQLEKQEITLQSIKNDIELSMKRMVEYQFIWTDLYNLLRLNNTIKIHFQKIYQTRTKGYHFLFNTLKELGIMYKIESTKELDFLAEQMINYSNTWLYNSFLYEKETDKNYIALQAEKLLYMLYPYLTLEGKKEFSKQF